MKKVIIFKIVGASYNCIVLLCVKPNPFFSGDLNCQHLQDDATLFCKLPFFALCFGEEGENDRVLEGILKPFWRLFRALEKGALQDNDGVLKDSSCFVHETLCRG